VSIADSIAALHGVIGAPMALHHRDARGGTGQVVVVALNESVCNLMPTAVARTPTGGRPMC
jgi:formyl-CoA transferase